MVKVARSGHKTEDSSESVSSFHSGAIFLPSLGHETSRNAFVGSIPFPGRISLWVDSFGHDPVSEECTDFRRFLSFSASIGRFRAALVGTAGGFRPIEEGLC